METFATRSDLRLLQYDDFARYCVKMATGSGKTKVMSLAIAWQFFNAVAEARDDFAKNVPPDRAKRDRVRAVADGFRRRSHLPRRPCRSSRDENLLVRLPMLHARRPRAASSLGALYLTNVQQFYERQNGGQDEPEELTAVLGPKPPAKTSEIETFDERIIDRGGPVVVLNDEAHHTHDEDSEWNKLIRGLPTRPPAAYARNWISRRRRATQGAALLLDRLRLSAQAGHHRQRRQTPAQGDRPGHR